MGRYHVLLEQEKTKQTTPSVSTPAATVAPPHSPAPLPPPKPDRLALSSRPEASSVHPKPSTLQPRKREFARRSFDFYADQIDYLTKTSLQERLDGGEGSMNAMVREALDDYIQKRKARK